MISIEYVEGETHLCLSNELYEYKKYKCKYYYWGYFKSLLLTKRLAGWPYNLLIISITIEYLYW